MRYLLDTNAVIAVLKNSPVAVRERVRETAATDASIAVSSVVLFELWYGVARSARPTENAERLRIFLSAGIDALAFEEDDAQAAGELRAELDAAGTPIGPYDLMIAGQALCRGATLVTANVAEFARVRGLRWEDWSAPA